MTLQLRLSKDDCLNMRDRPLHRPLHHRSDPPSERIAGCLCFEGIGSFSLMHISDESLIAVGSLYPRVRLVDSRYGLMR